MKPPAIRAVPPRHAAIAAAFLGLFLSMLPGAEAAAPADPAFFDESAAVSLFAFDDVSIPFTQNLKLEMRQPEKHPANPVLRRGGAEAPDFSAVQFYGSVIREGNQFRMWYVAAGKDRPDRTGPRSSPWRVAYAESADGVAWTKPDLGLVEYGGNRHNNLVILEPRLGVVNLKVLREQSGSPGPRYKLGAHVWFPKNGARMGTFAPYGSEDGLRWKLLAEAKPVNFELRPEDLVLPPLHFEPVGGLYRWDGLYRLSGQNAVVAPRPYHGRVVRGFVSADFVHWAPESSIGFVRPQQHRLLGPGNSRNGEQNHEAVSVWNRGNVLLGVSGHFHGAPEWSGVTVDLGFVLSNDGVHFRQPWHEWTFLKRGDDGEWDQGGLLQGQGFENIGERTFVYYGAWDPRVSSGIPPRGGVGIAMLPRDRFADLRVDERTQGSGNYQMARTECSFLTSSMDLPPEATHRLYLNARGLGSDAFLKIELLGHDLAPISGFSGNNAAIVRGNGFQTPVVWPGGADIVDAPERARVRATFEGKRRGDIRFHAFYLRRLQD